MSETTKKVVVTVYTNENCVQCNMTKKWLEARHIPYYVDYASIDRNLPAIKELGYSSAPVVFVNVDGVETHWSGFRHDLLEEHLGSVA